jgi:hypothetical protein
MRGPCRSVGSANRGGVLVYMCVWPIWPVYSPYRGPCIADYIPTLLGLEEYTGIAIPTLTSDN